MDGQAAIDGFRSEALAGLREHGRKWLNSSGIPAVFAAGLLAAAAVDAAESLLLNDSAAQQCFLAALRGGDARDVEVCDVALEHQALKSIDFAATLSNRGLLLARSERFDKALADHDRAIEMQPGIASLYINRSNTYARARRYEDAMRDLDRAIELLGARPPAAAQTPAAAGTAPPAAGRGAAPAQDPSRSRELAAAHYNRALLFQRQGDRAAALADARRASEILPERPGYRAYVQELEQLRATAESAPAD